MEIDYKGIGKRVRIKRKAMHLTQQVLAEKADLSETNISHIERGATKLSLPSLISLANALETTPNYLLMDVIDKSDVQFKDELGNLLKDCTKDECKILYDICKATLENLRK